MCDKLAHTCACVCETRNWVMITGDEQIEFSFYISSQWDRSSLSTSSPPLTFFLYPYQHYKIPCSPFKNAQVTRKRKKKDQVSRQVSASRLVICDITCALASFLLLPPFLPYPPSLSRLSPASLKLYSETQSFALYTLWKVVSAASCHHLGDRLLFEVLSGSGLVV